MIILPTDEEIISMKEFPFPESTCIEYKLSTAGVKIETTLCAFLNTMGGHVICGVRDDRMICWMDMSEKQIDLFIARIDSIISARMIRAENGSALPANAIKSRVVKNKEGKCIVILTAKPNDGVTYTFHGNSIYRLNVSNFYATSVVSYTAPEVALIKEQVKSDTTKHWQSILRSHVKTISKMERTVRSYEYALSKTEESRDDAVSLLHKKILEEKELKEKELNKTFVTKMSDLICGW